jgi:hypothetical protein
MALDRDARPFLAHHLRRRADALPGVSGAGLHELARWVENLPTGEPRMKSIATMNGLDYADGSFVCGPAAEALISAWDGFADVADRERWLDAFAATIVAEVST